MEKIAVVGIACLFPGANTLEGFWRNLTEGRDSRTRVTDERLGLPVKEFYDPQKSRPDTFYYGWGGYVEDFEMDPTGFQIRPEVILASDDIVQWSLHVAREALKDSGHWGNGDALAGCGVILGNLSVPTRSSSRLFSSIYYRAVEHCVRRLLLDEGFCLAPASSLGDPSSQGGRVSGHPADVVAKALALSGPHFALDAACASSLYAVKFACEALLTRKADLMLAGAVNASDRLNGHVGFSILQTYPEATEKSVPLDKDSRGLVLGEGAGMFVLKRYRDAVRDGDRVHAVIRGTGLSNDGRGQSVLSPNSKGQVVAFERAYADAGVDPKSIQYVECHATGTPRGDKVELHSMDAFFGRHHASPLVGSVKSNIGHLLTAAGMPGMTKAILSMARGEIPGTIGVRDPVTTPKGVIPPDRIPASTIAWPPAATPRRAAASAFGLGGTNAHLVFEEARQEDPEDGQHESDRPAEQGGTAALQMSPVAIVGMDAIFGACEGLGPFHRTIYAGVQHFVPVPAARWKGVEGLPELLRDYGFEDGRPPDGAYVERFDLDFLRHKIPPNEKDPLIPQQLLAMKVADNALLGAHVEPGGNVAVIIAMENDPSIHQWRGRMTLGLHLRMGLSRRETHLTPAHESELEDIVKNSVHNVPGPNQTTSFIGNIMASRIASLWDFFGPAFTLSSEENSVFKALEVGQRMLENGEVDAVVVGAVDLAGGVESVLWRNRDVRVNTGRRTLSFDQEANGWLVGEGAGAVVLKRLEDARRSGDRIFATIDGVAIGNGVSSLSVSQACRQAFENARVEPWEIGYLEVFGSGVAQEDDAEIKGLHEAYGNSCPESRCAIGSVKANIGHTFAASGMASLIKTALCLSHRYIPGTPNWSGPKSPAEWEGSPFYVPAESRTWYPSGPAGRRVAAVNGLGQDGSCAHLILSEGPAGHGVASDYLEEVSPFLFPLASEDQAGLKKDLDVLRQEVLRSASLSRMSALCHERCRARGAAEVAMAIVGQDREEILQEIDIAREAVEKAFANGREWVSLRGSYLTPNPLGNTGKIAFVYPGGYNSYVGVGRDLFQLFPSVYEEVCKYSSRLGEMIGEGLVYPRSLEKPSAKDLNARERSLLDSPITMFESGILFSIAYTRMMRDCFRVEPQIALGYSMGEVSMMYALGVWAETDAMSESLRDSPVFRTRLAGPMETVRQAWGLPKAAGDDERIWACYALRTSASRARKALKEEDRAYLIFINSPNEVVIAGEDRACKRVMRGLGCDSFDVAIGHAIHCEVARLEHDELVRVHTLPAHPVDGIDFYSAHRFAPLPIDTQVIANNIATIYSHEIDFPRLVHQAYRDGARVFIEVGARQNCTNWIGEILGEKPHLAVGVNRKGAGEKASILRALARLHSHRVPLDLSPLYAKPKGEVAPRKSLIKSTWVGGTSIPSSILNPENEKRFRPVFEGIPVASQPVPVPAVPAKAERRSTLPSGLSETEGGDRRPEPLLRNESMPAEPGPFDRNLSLINASHSAFLETRREGLRQIGEMIRLKMNLTRSGGTPVAGERAVASSRHFAPPSASTERREEKTRARLPREGVSVPAKSPEPEGTLTLDELLRRYPPRDKGAQDRTKPPGEIFDYWDLREFAEGDIGKVFGEEYAVIDAYRRRVRIPLEPYLLVSRVTKLDAQKGVFKPCSMTTEYDIPYNAWYSIDGQIPWAVAVESGQCDLWLISYLGIDFECKGERVYRLLDCTLTFLEEVPREGDTLRYDIKINSFARTGGTLLFFFSYDCYVKERRIIEMRGGCAGFFTDEELEAGKGIIHTGQEIEEKRKIEKKQFTPLLRCSRSRFERPDLVALARGGKGDCFGPAYEQGGLNPALHFTAEPMLMLDRVVSVDPGGGAWGLGMIVAEKDLAPDHWYFPCHFKDDNVLAGSLMAEGCGQLVRFYMLYLGLQTRTRDARFQPVFDLPQKVRCRGEVIPKHTLLTYRAEVKEIGTGPSPYVVVDMEILLGEKIVVDFKDLGVVMVESDAEATLSRKRMSEGRADQPDARDGDGEVLFTRVQLEEFATGSMEKCFGPEFSLYEGRKVPRTPNGDLQLISRVLETKGTRLDFKQPAGVVTEYDVPEDAWFFRENSHRGVAPYSILMESALQPNLFISTWMGTTLTAPDVDFYFRNLDGEGTVLRRVDLRGKTITNRSELLSTVTTGNTIIQQFRWDLSHEGEPFYEGTAVFGYFLHAALTNQVGLDGGIANDPLQTREYLSDVSVVHIDLKSAAARERLYAATETRPYERLAGTQLDFLDEVHIVEQGGKHGLGYVCGYKKIDPSDWFYPCHFHQDPVMPGSLGVESILQAMQIFSLHQDLGAPFRSPHFCQRLNHRILWKYRGQLIPTDDRMVIEVHIKSVEREPERVTVIGDASLWKNELRIYEITDAAICLEESGAG